MKSKVNVVIAKRGRWPHLLLCLAYLDKANLKKSFDVEVYIIDDCVEPSTEFLIYPNINITLSLLPLTGNFNKSVLLNHGLSIMRKEFDWVSVVDLDILYTPLFFEKVYDNLKYIPVVICQGRDLQPTENAGFTEWHPFREPIASNYGKANRGNSQVSMIKYAFTKIIDIYGTMYSEEFVGWGGEDTDVTWKIKDMAIAGVIPTRRVLTDMWLHLWHESKKTQTNRYLLFKRVQDNRARLDEWRNNGSNNSLLQAP